MLRAYDYVCPDGHTTEKFLHKFVDHVPCGFQTKSGPCTKECEYRPSFWYTSPIQTARRIQNAQRFPTVVIYKSKDGNIRLPGSNSIKTPRGYERVELTDLAQVRKFEKEYNQGERIKMQEHRAMKDKAFDANVKASREAMAKILPKFSDKGRAFYEAMKTGADMKREMERAKPTQDPNFYLDAFAFNASNREDHRDAGNDWGQRNRR